MGCLLSWVSDYLVVAVIGVCIGVFLALIMWFVAGAVLPSLLDVDSSLVVRASPFVSAPPPYGSATVGFLASGCSSCFSFWSVVSGCYFAHGVTSFRWPSACILLVNGNNIVTIWVVFPLQTGVAARVLLLGFVFLWICVSVAVVFMVRWVGGVVSVPFAGLWVCGWCFK